MDVNYWSKLILGVSKLDTLYSITKLIINTILASMSCAYLCPIWSSVWSDVHFIPWLTHWYMKCIWCKRCLFQALLCLSLCCLSYCDGGTNVNLKWILDVKYIWQYQKCYLSANLLVTTMEWGGITPMFSKEKYIIWCFYNNWNRFRLIKIDCLKQICLIINKIKVYIAKSWL